MPFQPDNQQTNQNDFLPQLVGALTGTVGQALGGAVDVGTFGAATPLVNPVTTGATLGGLGQGATQAIQNVFTGKPVGQNVAPEAMQGGIWGALPGGEEARAGKIGTEALAKTGIGDIIKNLIKRGGLGAIAGGGVQGVQNIQQGKPIFQNVPQSAAVAGGLNAIAPGIGKVLGKPLQAFAGTPQGVLSQVAKFFVGDKLARDPEIVKHLDLQMGDWKTSQDKLVQAAEQVYKPIVDAASQKTARLGDFIDSVKNGMLQEKDMTTEKINTNIRNVIDFIARNTGGHLGQLNEATKKMESLVSKPSLGGGPVGSRSRTMFENINRLVDSMKELNVPGNVLNEAKKLVGKWYKDGEYNPAYTEAKNFIEKMAPEVDVKGINKLYAKYHQAANELEKNFAGKRTQEEMNRGMGWMQRMAMTIGAGLAGGAVGLPTGSIYGSAGGGMTSGAGAYVLTALKDAMTKTPQRAVKYAKGLQKTGPALQTALQQLLLRGKSLTQ